MAAIPSLEEEEAKRQSRERENLVGERTRIGNRIKSALARLGIRGFGRPCARPRSGSSGCPHRKSEPVPTHWPSCGARGHGCACSPTRSGRSRPRACNGWNSDSIAASIRWSDCWRGFGVLASGLQTAHELRLADAGWPQQQQGFAMRYPAAPGEFADLPRIERRLGGKVEAVEVAHRGEVGDLPAISTRHSSLRRDLALEQKKGQRLAEGQLAPGGLVPTDCRAGRGSPLA